MDLLDIDVDDFVNSQIIAFEKFMKHDAESYEESENLKLQYIILKTLKEDKIHL